MYKISFDYDFPGPVKSFDPILDILAKDPSVFLGKRFAGYCFFLFGAADEPLATWFTRNLVALDSLTGSEIACIVIAARIKVRVDRKSWQDRLAKFAKHKEKLHETHLSDIDRQHIKAEPLVSSWTGAAKEIEAITYGADAFAKQLGILDELPCLVVLDAIPSKSFEIVRLTEHAADSLISVLRDVISRFQTREYDSFFVAIAAVEQLQSHSGRLQRNIETVQRKLIKMQSMNGAPGLRDDRAAARDALMDGNLRAFKAAVNASWDLQPEQRSVVLGDATLVTLELLQISKTSKNLAYFLEQDGWPLQEPWLSRLFFIYSQYARPLLPESLQTPSDNRDYCLLVLNSLQRRQEELVAQVLSRFPNVEDHLLVRREEHQQECLVTEREIENLQHELKNTLIELNLSIDNLLATEYPSLKDAFRDTARKRKLTTARKSIGTAIFKVGEGLLKPETWLKIVEALQK